MFSLFTTLAVFARGWTLLYPIVFFDCKGSQRSRIKTREPDNWDGVKREGAIQIDE